MATETFSERCMWLGQKGIAYLDQLTGQVVRRVDAVPAAQDEPAPAPVAEDAPPEEPISWRDCIDADVWDLYMGQFKPEIVGTRDAPILENIAAGSVNIMLLLTIARRLKGLLP